MKSGTFEKCEKVVSETYPIKNFDDYEGLLLSHSQKRIILVLKHAMEFLDIVFRVRVNLGKFSEHGDVWIGLFQKINECGDRRPPLRLVSQRRLHGLPKLVRKSKFLSIWRPWWSPTIRDPYHHL